MAEKEKTCCQMFKKHMRENPEKFAFDNGGRCFGCKKWYDLSEIIAVNFLPKKFNREEAYV